MRHSKRFFMPEMCEKGLGSTKMATFRLRSSSGALVVATSAARRCVAVGRTTGRASERPKAPPCSVLLISALAV